MSVHSLAVHSLTVPYADTRADQLTLALDRPRLPALAERDWQIGDLTVHLRLLGASHQVFVSGPITFSETLACLPGQPAHLPTRVRERGYRFDAEITTGSDAVLRSVVDDLIARADAAVASGTPVLIGRFPRHRLAVTALFASVDDAVASWQTWHVYPQSGEIVVTRSELDCAA